MVARGASIEHSMDYDMEQPSKPSGALSQDSPTSPTSNNDQIFPTGKSVKHSARGVSFRDDVKDNTKQSSAQSGKMTPEISGTSQTHTTNTIDQPILDMASECDDAFIEAIDGSETELRTSLEEYQRRFHAWASYLGVFSSHRSNLDRRLRLHPEIEDIVLSTLDMLLINLVQLVPKHLRDPAAPLNIGQVALDGVRSAVVELNKLGMNIRQSSSTDLESRVKSFAARRLREDIGKFVPVALAVAKTLYPNAATSLHDQLCKSIVNRYAKLLYWRSHANKLGADLRPKTDTHPQEPNSNEEVIMMSQQTRGEFDHVAPTGLEDWAEVHGQVAGLGKSQHLDHDISGTDPSTMSPLGAGKKRAFNSDARSSDASSIVLSGVGYPRPPKIKEADNEVSCDMCCKKFDKKQYEDERWWRQHVHQDLTPFICISQDCVNDPAFSSFRDWRSHMTEQHGKEWSQRVHVAPTWYCELCEEQSPPYSSALQLEDHVRASHQALLEDFRSFPSSFIPRETRPLGVCPLCCRTVDLPKGATLDATDNVLDELLDITTDQSATLVVRTKDSTSKRQKFAFDHGTRHHRATSENDNIGSAMAEISQPVDPDRLSLMLALSRHIAEHLQYLTFLTLRLMPHKLGEDGEAGQEDENCESDQADGASNPVDDEQMSWGTDSPPIEETNHDSYGSPVDWRGFKSLNLLGTRSSGEVDETEGPLDESIVILLEGEEVDFTARRGSLSFNLIAQGTVNRLANPQVIEVTDSKTIDFGDRQTSSSYYVELTWHRRQELWSNINKFWIVQDSALPTDVLLGDRSVRHLKSNDNGLCAKPAVDLSQIASRIAPKLARWLTNLELIVKARQKSGVFKPTKVAILDNGISGISSVSHETAAANKAAGRGGEPHTPNPTTAPAQSRGQLVIETINLASVLANEPYIFITGEKVPPLPSILPHMKKRLKNYAIEEIRVDKTGFFILFQNSYHGRSEAERCYRAVNHTEFFNYDMAMQLCLPQAGRPSSSKNQGHNGASGTDGKDGSTTSTAKADADLPEDSRSLWARIKEGRSFVDEESRLSPWMFASDPHGTQMANLICAIDPFCELYVAKVSEDQFGISAKSVKKAIEWARSKDVDIISMGFVIEESDKSPLQEIERASDQGIVMVCSAREEGNWIAEAYPAADALHKRSIIALAASDEYGKPLGYFNDDAYKYMICGQFAATDVVQSGPTATRSSAATALAAGISSLVLTCDRLANADKRYTPGVEEGSRYEMVTRHMDMMQSTEDSKFVLLEKFSLIDTPYIRDILSSTDPPNHTAILQSLDYSGRPFREAAIVTAYATTFEWIFDGSKFPFQSWLQQDNGCFWINGKLGSGKSTLMKFIAGHPRTAEALSAWAGPNKLATANHYLWSAGMPMQKSMEGLLRSILYSILRGAPELIPAVCSSERTKSSASANAPWLTAELITTIRKFAQLTESPIKCCIFIDELDAFDGHLDDAVQLIRDLAQSPYCKICVSSRPWCIFEDAFGYDPLRWLVIHDLTRPDIEMYVRGQLDNDPRWHKLQIRDGGTAASLIREITDRAQGVFLWVVLVTKSIRLGLTHHDTIPDLRKRIDALPTDMEDLFKHSLDAVDPFYRQSMAGSLLIALAAISPLHVTIYHFYDAQPTRPLTVEQLSDLVQSTSRRLNVQCKGLLEVRNDNRVHFTHRTVRDFLLTPEMSDYLHTHCRLDFSPSLSIFWASVERIKRSPFPSEIESRGEPGIDNQPRLGQALTEGLTETLQYAVISEAEDELATRDALNDLEWSIGKMAESGQIILSREAGGLTASAQARHLFRELAHQLGLDGYLQKNNAWDG